MNTEKHIVYEILNIVNNHDYNNDQPVTERLLRGYLKTFRPDLIRKFYRDGVSVTDECVQSIQLPLIKSGKMFTAKVPKIIRLEKSAGMRVSIQDAIIPIVDLEQFELNKLNRLGRINFQSKIVGETLTLFCPAPTDKFSPDHFYFSIMESLTKPNPTIALESILVDPSDDPGYDWENDIYPFPAEKEYELIGQILAKVFGISIQMKKDEVQNGRADRIIYQDEFNVNGGQ